MSNEHFGELANHQAQQRQEAGGSLIRGVARLWGRQQKGFIGDDAAVVDVGVYGGIVGTREGRIQRHQGHGQHANQRTRQRRFHFTAAPAVAVAVAGAVAGNA